MRPYLVTSHALEPKGSANLSAPHIPPSQTRRTAFKVFALVLDVFGFVTLWLRGFVAPWPWALDMSLVSELRRRASPRLSFADDVLVPCVVASRL